MEPILAIVDIDIHPNHDEAAREHLLTKLAGYDGDAVAPLWVNNLRMRADLRLVCLINRLDCFDDFLVDQVRSVRGVRATESYLAFDGAVFGSVIDTIALQDSPWTRQAAATTMVQVGAGHEQDVYRALTSLPAHNQVEVAYTLKLFHCHNCDLMVLLLGERTAALSAYVTSWIRTVPGVSDTEVISTLDWKVLGKTDDFIRLAQRYPEPAIAA